ncbi:MAG: hypothetical protein IJS63_09405 [Bacteroidaceae bacterium]|nr:hypothetical protein [Bacteroidaceae bacterium]
MINKVLGQEIADLEARKQFLLDNADSVVEMDYHKQFDSDELAKKKTELSEACIRINDIEEDIKDYREKANVELKPLKKLASNFSLTSSQRGVWSKRSAIASLSERKRWSASTMAKVSSFLHVQLHAKSLNSKQSSSYREMFLNYQPIKNFKL